MQGLTVGILLVISLHFLHVWLAHMVYVYMLEVIEESKEIKKY